jgi:hypothetical protein
MRAIFCSSYQLSHLFLARLKEYHSSISSSYLPSNTVLSYLAIMHKPVLLKHLVLTSIETLVKNSSTSAEPYSLVSADPSFVE